MPFRRILSAITAVAIFLLVTQVEAKGATQSTSAGTRDALDSFIAQQMEEAGIVGLGAALIVHKKVVWMRGYGYADRERRVPFTPDTIMNIGSISKTFTGVALMRAVQEGKLSLDEDINTYLPFKVINPHYPKRHTHRIRRVRSRGEHRNACQSLQRCRRHCVREHLAIWRGQSLLRRHLQ